jgi:hypothetical protein
MVWEGTHDVPLSPTAGLPAHQPGFLLGRAETVTVRTAAGYELTCTPDHRLMTDRGWVAAADLASRSIGCGSERSGVFSADDTLPVETPAEFTGRNGRQCRHCLPTRWSADLGFVLGWLVGDGWLRGGDVSIRGSASPSAPPTAPRSSASPRRWTAGTGARRGCGSARARPPPHVPGKFFAAFFERSACDR